MGISYLPFQCGDRPNIKSQTKLAIFVVIIACSSAGCSDGFKVKSPQGDSSGTIGNSSRSSSGNSGGSTHTSTTQPKSGTSSSSTTMINPPTTTTIFVSTSTTLGPTSTTLLSTSTSQPIPTTTTQPSATSTTISNPNQVLIDVRKFGAIPNDSNDDVVTIENAIASANAGETVFFPNGVYLISRAVGVTRSNIRLKGESQDGVIIKYSGSSKSGMITLNNVKGIELAFLTLDGNHQNVDIAIGATNGDHHYLHHLTIRDLGEPLDPNRTSTIPSGNLGIHFISDVTDSEISDNIITNAGPNTEWGGGIRVSWRSSRNKILRNTIQNTGRGGIFCNDDGEEVIIKNNIIAGSGLIKDSPGLGIEVWGRCHRSIIEDNKLDHWLSIDGCDQVAVRRNILSDSSRLKFIGLEFVAAVGGVFTDNMVESGSQVCISASNTKKKDFAFWGYNKVSNCGTWGAQFQGEAEGANYHYFFQSEFWNSGKNLPETPWYAGEGHGFRFNGNTNYVTFDQSTFSGNIGAGIQGSGSNIAFLNSKITNNGAAFTTLDGGNNFEFLNNIVNGNGNNQVPVSTPNLPSRPNVSINGPTIVRLGDSADYSPTFESTSGATIKQVLWDFNDGVPSMTPTTSHIFSKKGTFRLNLIVWDTNGRSTRSEKWVTVN